MKTTLYFFTANNDNAMKRHYSYLPYKDSVIHIHTSQHGSHTVHTVTDNTFHVAFYSLQLLSVVTTVYNHNSYSLRMQIKPYFKIN